MAFDPHPNFAYSTVSTAPSPATTGLTLVVTDASVFPDPASVGAYNCTVWAAGADPSSTNAEIVRVTGKSGSTLTISRHQESTSARTVVAGDQIAASDTSKVFTDIEAAIPTAAGGALDGTYPDPDLAASVAGAGLDLAANVLSVNGVTVAMVDAEASSNGDVPISDGAGNAAWGAPPGGATLTKAINQTGHSLSVGHAVRLDGTDYVAAQADSAANAEAVGIVSVVTGVDDFTLHTGGRITGLSGLTAGTVYFLDPSVAGGLTATEPVALGQVSKPLLIADTTTSGYLIDMRGIVVDYAARVFIALGKPSDALAVAEDLGMWRVDATLNGKTLVGVEVSVATKSTSGLPSFGLRRIRGGTAHEVLTTNVTIDANEWDSTSAATPAVIDSSYDDLQTGDLFVPDCDAAGTGTKGAGITLLVL